MKTLETKYDKHGWKIIVKRSKENNYHIYLRSKDGNHKIHKPFYLRLSEKNVNTIIKFIRELKLEAKKTK